MADSNKIGRRVFIIFMIIATILQICYMLDVTCVGFVWTWSSLLTTFSVLRNRFGERFEGIIMGLVKKAENKMMKIIRRCFKSSGNVNTDAEMGLPLIDEDVASNEAVLVNVNFITEL